MAYLNYPEKIYVNWMYRVECRHSTEECLSLFKNNVMNKKSVDPEFLNTVTRLTLQNIDTKIYYAPVFDATVNLDLKWSKDKEVTNRNTINYDIRDNYNYGYNSYSVTTTNTQTVTQHYSDTKTFSFKEHVGTIEQLRVLDYGIFSSAKTLIKSYEELGHPLWNKECMLHPSRFESKAIGKYKAEGKTITVSSCRVSAYFVPLLEIKFAVQNKYHTVYFNLFNKSFHYELVANREAIAKARLDEEKANKFNWVNVILTVCGIVLNFYIAISNNGNILWDILFCALGLIIIPSIAMGLTVALPTDFNYFKEYYGTHGCDKGNISYVYRCIAIAILVICNVAFHAYFA